MLLAISGPLPWDLTKNLLNIIRYVGLGTEIAPRYAWLPKKRTKIASFLSSFSSPATLYIRWHLRNTFSYN
jgi:hypothetical protein